MKEKNKTPTQFRGQLMLATGLTLFGCAMLVAGFLVPPMGVIHPSVLVAGGEVFTFAGSLMGLDYSYKYRNASRHDS